MVDREHHVATELKVDEKSVFGGERGYLQPRHNISVDAFIKVRAKSGGDVTSEIVLRPAAQVYLWGRQR
ncbi:hypothetical protein RHOFW510R12_07595 [Rhodanobacter sp. FW510-R12]